MSTWGNNNDAVDDAAKAIELEKVLDEVGKEAAGEPHKEYTIEEAHDQGKVFAEMMIGVIENCSVEARTQLCHKLLCDAHHVIHVNLGEQVMVVMQCPENFILQTIAALLEQSDVTKENVERIRKIILEEEDVTIN